MSIRRIVVGGLAVAGLLVAATALAAYLWLRASLPALDGERPLAGLRDEVVVERDDLGVPTIRGADRRDVARATGYVHAQDRYFQMDLLRRSAAGELAALVGPAAVEVDRGMRLHGLRRVAERVVAELPPDHRALLQAYAEGVNTGLAALGARPFEYALLQTPPQPWQPADTVLVIFAMYVDLQDIKATREARLALLRQALPPSLYRFVTAHDATWDAPLDGSEVAAAPLPLADEVSLRGRRPVDPVWAAVDEIGGDQAVGSNNWAVGPAASADGNAWLADDMHLGLRLPNVWYRLRLEWRDGAVQRAVTGLSLPGTPAVIAGSNGRVAWGFTNSYGDWSDLVMLEPDPGDRSRYRTPDGYRPFRSRVEEIAVKGGEPVRMEVRDTIWGPVLPSTPGEPLRAIRWIAQEPAATDLGLLGLETAADVEAALAVANRAGMPSQNFLAVDRAGNIGWTVTGRLPRRVGYDPDLPAAGADGGGWQGWLPPERYPRIVNPADGRLWTANNRVVGGDALALLGDGGYAHASRAWQIREGLRALETATPEDLLNIQLDDRALFLGRWRELLLEVLDAEALDGHPRRAALRDAVANWSGRAAPEDVGYRLVRAFRLYLHDAVFAALTADARALDPEFRFDLPQGEYALWRLASERPEHLLDSRYATWRDQLLATVDAVVRRFWDEQRGFADATWGAYNTLRMGHPLTQALPWLADWLNAPAQPLPGDSFMPRVQRPTSGASQRLVVSPAREADSVLHMPGGQSGHPLSPYYLKGHDAWVEGRPTPFLPGPAVHTLRLRPAG